MKQFLTTMPPIKYLLAALASLVIGDGLITEFLVQRGLGREGNPLLQDLVGEWGFLAAKFAGALVCVFILADIHKRWPKLAMISTSCFVVCYGAIVIWNLYVFFATTM